MLLRRIQHLRLCFLEKRGYTEDRRGHDHRLRVHQQCPRGHTVLSTGMAVPVGPHQRGGDIAVLFGHGHDSSGVD